MQNSRIRAALMGLIVACSASMSMGDYADKQAPASSASITQTHAKVPAVPDNRASDSLFADRLAAMRRSVLLVRENVLSVVCHETLNRRDSNHPNITTVGFDIAVVEGQEQPLGILQGTTLSRSFKPLKRWMRGEFFGNLDSTQAALEAHPEWRERVLFTHFHCGKLIALERRAIAQVPVRISKDDGQSANAVLRAIKEAR